MFGLLAKVDDTIHTGSLLLKRGTVVADVLHSSKSQL